jgi:hypothetical protein
MCGWHSCDCFFPKAATFYSGSRNNPKSDQAGATGAWVTRKRSLAAVIDRNCFLVSFVAVPFYQAGPKSSILAFFWRFCPIGKRARGRPRPSGQAMREKRRDSGAAR